MTAILYAHYSRITSNLIIYGVLKHICITNNYNKLTIIEYKLNNA